MGEAAIQGAVRAMPATQLATPAVDSGLMGLSLVAGYYRIAADPAQLKHQLALIGRFASAEDLIRGSNILGLKSRILKRVSIARLGEIPYPALLKMRNGGFVALGAGSAKGRVRVVDPVTRVPADLTLKEAWDDSAHEVVLITRRLGGAGFDPTTFGFRWFLPSILRYRKPLAQVVIASMFVQLFALITPIFFQLIVDKVLVHKGYSTLLGSDRRPGLARAVREFAATVADLHAYPHHQPHRRRTRAAAVSSPVPAAASLFRDPALPGRRSPAFASWRRFAASSPGKG